MKATLETISSDGVTFRVEPCSSIRAAITEVKKRYLQRDRKTLTFTATAVIENVVFVIVRGF